MGHGEFSCRCFPVFCQPRLSADDRFRQPQQTPALVGLPLVSMAAGNAHAAAVTASGTAYVWGGNRRGEGARPFPQALTVPVPVAPPPLPSPPSEREGEVVTAEDVVIRDAACGLAHSVFVNSVGRLLVCGANDRGQLGIAASELPSTTHVVPVPHPRGGAFVAAEAGRYHSLVLDSDGDAWVTDENGLHCVISGKRVLALAAGGEGNCIAVTAAPDGRGALRRQFSTKMSVDPKVAIETVDRLLEEVDAGEAGQQRARREVARKVEELLGQPSILNMVVDPGKLDITVDQILCAGDKEMKQMIANAVERGVRCVYLQQSYNCPHHCVSISN